MITFDTREPAPISVRWARVVAPLVMCFAYLTLRVAPATHERIPLGELLASGALFVGLTFVAFIALGDVLFPATPAEAAAETDPESTGVFERVKECGHRRECDCQPERYPGWQCVGESDAGVKMDLAYADLGLMFPERYPAGSGQIVGKLPGPSTWAAELRELADDEAWEQHTADTEELELLTHEFVPQHHTPARGFVAPALQAAADRLERDARTMVPRTVTGRIPSPEPRTTGRHRLVKD